MGGSLNDSAHPPAPEPEENHRADGDLEAARERNRRYRRAHPEQHAASTRRWKEANPERVRELNRRWREQNLERSRELNRESARRSATRNRRLKEKRRRANEASKRWKVSHPDEVRAYRRGWAAANREKLQEYYARYRGTHREELNDRATAWRDSAPEKMKRARKAWADRNKERTAEIQRKRRSDPEKYRADLDANSAAKRLARRLERAGLPPKRVHRTTAAERRANARSADEYFGDSALPERLRQFTIFTEMLSEEVVKHGDRLLGFAESYVATRVRVGLPPVDARQFMYARAAEVVAERMKRVDLLTSREIGAAVRSAKSTAERAARERRVAELIAAVELHLGRNRTRLHEDATLENTLRVRRGKPRQPAEVIVVRSAIEEVLETSIWAWLNHADAIATAKQVELMLIGAVQGPAPARPGETVKRSARAGPGRTMRIPQGHG